MTEQEFKCGIEIHQQLDTQTKLFCGCPVKSVDRTPDGEISRYLRSTKGESGQEDEAAKKETMSLSRTRYQHYEDAACLVELDEEPPHSINQEAMDVALKFALMLECDIPEELQIMRKIVVDGSNTSGFQRTAMVGYEGQLETSHGKVGIEDIELEEESAKVSGTAESENVYSLDRLGIPLIEVGTDTSIETPDHAREVAEKLGMLLRSTGKARRGLGTIRQDVNVSVPGGNRVEIKGFQDVERIDRLVRNEIERQENLIDLGNAISGQPEVKEVTETFAQAGADFVGELLSDDGIALAITLPDLAGKLNEEISPGRRLVEELVDYAKSAGVEGLIHSDEDLSQYGVEQPFEQMLDSADDDEAVAVVIAGRDRCRNACEEVESRARKLYSGEIPEETRQGQDDCTTSYLRPLPGSARMYPETDIPPVTVDEDYKARLESDIPPTLDKLQERAAEKVGSELASSLRATNNLILFSDIVEEHQEAVTPSDAANLLVNDIPQLRSRGVEVSDVSKEYILQGLEHLEQSLSSRDQLVEAIRSHLSGDSDSLDQAVQGLVEDRPSDERIRQVVLDVIDSNEEMVSEKGEAAKGPLMGDVMAQVDADGSRVSEILSEELSASQS